MTPVTLRALVAVLALTALLAACGGGDDAADAPADDGADAPADDAADDAADEPAGDDQAGGDAAESVTLQTTEFAFDPDEFTIPADETVEVVVDNSQGVVEHDFALDEADVVVYAQPGETASGTFSVGAGTYTFYCSIPGHRESGMEGTLTVE